MSMFEKNKWERLQVGKVCRRGRFDIGILIHFFPIETYN